MLEVYYFCKMGYYFWEFFHHNLSNWVEDNTNFIIYAWFVLKSCCSMILLIGLYHIWTDWNIRAPSFLY